MQSLVYFLVVLISLHKWMTVSAQEFQIIGEKVYASSPTVMNQTLARAYCTNNGMELISIPNAKTQASVTKIIRWNAFSSAWTSGNDESERGSFEWSGMTLPINSSAYTNWQLRFPQKVTFNTYIVVAPNLMWENLAGSTNRSVICVADLDVFLSRKCYQRQMVLKLLGKNEFW